MDPAAAAVLLVVRQWSDAQLRRAWRTAGHALGSEDPRAVARAAEVRGVLLVEWERRHPQEGSVWSTLELD